jgi:uncharacterized membrane protein
MVGTLAAAAIFFVVGLVVSTVIIYVVTKLFGEREGMETALPAALVGTIVYALSYYFLGHGLYAALISGFVWLLALGGLYNMSWLKALGIAIIVWIAAAFVGLVLPTVVGPL